MMTLSLADAAAWTTGVFLAHGALPANAQSVARALVMAEADGLKGHGLTRIPSYVAMMKSGKIDGKAVPKLAQPKPAIVHVDAACGFAYPAIDLACRSLPDAARACGIAFGAISRSSHAGAVGHHVERLANNGFVALFFANTPEAIAPWGGTKPVFGTNPIAFAAPLAAGPPIVVDLALSKVARGNIVAAKQAGGSIPEGWALDKSGQPTTDPDAALAGTMVPMGDAKGAALALMVEVLAAALTDSHFGFEASSFLDSKGPPSETGQSLIVIDPAAMGTTFPARMATLAAAIVEQPNARLPGRRRLALRATAEAKGLEIPEALVQQFGMPA
jgi:(2R)-3-sulfolactate dehydrogenase (NADP+)